MLGFGIYNFCGDTNALDPLSTNLNMNKSKISNAIFDHVTITKDVLKDFGFEYPTWDFDTILDAPLNGSLAGGNIDYILEQIQSIRIKRRRKGTFNWVSLKEIPVNGLDSLKFISQDAFSPSSYEFEYAVVPVMSDNTEGEYNITTILTQFDGIFVCDVDTIISMYSGITLNRTSNQSVGELQPIGAKYPITINNGDVDYESGTLGATILGTDFITNKKLDPSIITDNTTALMNFLKNKKPKILKDWNGNIWLVMITGNPTISSNVVTGVNSVDFSWSEQGEYDNQYDLYINGLTEIP